MALNLLLGLEDGLLQTCLQGIEDHQAINRRQLPKLTAGVDQGYSHRCCIHLRQHHQLNRFSFGEHHDLGLPLLQHLHQIAAVTKTRTGTIWDGFRPTTVRGLRTKWIAAINSADMSQDCHRGLPDHAQARPGVPETSSQAQLRGFAKTPQQNAA